MSLTPSEILGFNTQASRLNFSYTAAMAAPKVPACVPCVVRNVWDQDRSTVRRSLDGSPWRVHDV